MENSKEKKWTLWLLRFCSVLYAFLYPVIFLWSFMSLMVSDKPGITALVFYSIVLPCISMPIFTLIGIWKMWENYVRGEYKKARRYTVLPIFAIVIMLLVVIFVDRISH